MSGPTERDACKRGHDFTPENTIWRSSGDGRSCRACRRAAAQRREVAYQKKRKGSVGLDELRSVNPHIFWGKVEKSEACWLWTGATGVGDYGRVFVPSLRTSTSAHRVAWALSGRPLPEGHELDHLCRRPRCVNPLHLELVEPAENNARSLSPSALNARKTHCKHGHEFTSDNTYTPPSGGRYCRACRAVADKSRRDRADRLDPTPAPSGHATEGDDRD